MRLKHTGAHFHAPAFLTLEVGNVLTRKRRREELTVQDAEDIWMTFRGVLVRRHTDETLVLAAFDVSQETKMSLYDNLYLALGIKLDVPFLTADRKFYHSLQSTQYRSNLLWIEDL